MKSVARLLVCVLMVHPAAAQVPDAADVWRTFAAKVEVGSSIKVRLQDGPPFTATLVEAQAGALLLQPRTRVPVPVQAVPYDSIVSIERVRGGGIGPGKAAAIGVLTGAGAFFATLVIFLAAIND
jgi:hypothetical protein